MSDSELPKYRPKRYHKRSTWACDECKLRKKKCDGKQPCAKCQMYEKECTYESRTRPSQPPTQRIRNLEENIRSVRDFLSRIKPELSGQNLTEVNELLEELRPAAAVEYTSQQDTSPQTVSSTFSRGDNESLQSMLVGRGRLLQSGSKTFFHGPYSGAALVCSCLEFFEPMTPENIHQFVIELFDRSVLMPPGATVSLDMNIPAGLPEKSEAIVLVRSLLAQSHPFLKFLDPSALWQIVEAVYGADQNTTSRWAVPFCHIVFALGYLMNTAYHQEEGCGWAVAQASNHFQSTRMMLRMSTVEDLMCLQALVCTIIYLVWTSQLSTAYTFISIAATSAIKQGLHMTAEVITGSSKSVKSTQKQLLTTLVNIDLYISTVLGLPPLINIDTAGTVLAGGQKSTQATSQSFFSHQTNDLSLQPESCDASVKYSQVISLTASVVWNLSASSTNQSDQVTTTETDTKILRQVEKDLATWTAGLGIALSPSTMVSDEPISQTSVARHELELAFYWSQLVINFPFLHYLRPLAQGQSLPESSSRPALTCLKVAVNTIIRCNSLLQTQLDSEGHSNVMNPSNWTCVYTVFLAVLALVFLISIHEGTSKPSEAWRKAENGIRILEAMRCDEGAAGRCLAVVKEFVRQLNYTVDFDLESIEKTTRRVCERQHTSFGVTSSREPLQTHSTHGNLARNLGHDHTFLNANMIAPNQTYNVSHSVFSADEMLAKAQELPLATNLGLHSYQEVPS